MNCQSCLYWSRVKRGYGVCCLAVPPESYAIAVPIVDDVPRVDLPGELWTAPDYSCNQYRENGRANE